MTEAIVRLDNAVAGLSNNDQILHNKMLQFDSLWGLYLEFRKKVLKEDTEEFNKFVKAKAEEFEKQQRSEDKKGA